MVSHNDRRSDRPDAYPNDDKSRAAQREEGLSVPSLERISELLHPYLAHPLERTQLEQVSQYLHLLQKWNAVINLTAVREPEQMVSRHFGESFFAAGKLLTADVPAQVVDFGSGAGFPGMPLAIYAPQVRVELIESRGKKATFLKEVARTLNVSNVHVVEARGEDYSISAGLVTMRAVDDFERSLPAAAALVAAGGRLALLIGDRQVGPAMRLLPTFIWSSSIQVPGGQYRVLAVGTRQ